MQVCQHRPTRAGDRSSRRPLRSGFEVNPELIEPSLGVHVAFRISPCWTMSLRSYRRPIFGIAGGAKRILQQITPSRDGSHWAGKPAMKGRN
jgi:hypothetical protein